MGPRLSRPQSSELLGQPNGKRDCTIRVVCVLLEYFVLSGKIMIMQLIQFVFSTAIKIRDASKLRIFQSYERPMVPRDSDKRGPTVQDCVGG